MDGSDLPCPAQPDEALVSVLGVFFFFFSLSLLRGDVTEADKRISGTDFWSVIFSGLFVPSGVEGRRAKGPPFFMREWLQDVSNFCARGEISEGRSNG